MEVTGAMREKPWEGLGDIARCVLSNGLARFVVHWRRIHARQLRWFGVRFGGLLRYRRCRFVRGSLAFLRLPLQNLHCSSHALQEIFPLTHVFSGRRGAEPAHMDLWLFSGIECSDDV